MRAPTVRPPRVGGAGAAVRSRTAGTFTDHERAIVAEIREACSRQGVRFEVTDPAAIATVAAVIRGSGQLTGPPRGEA